MELPIELKNIIDEELEKASFKNLQKNAENISIKYRNETEKKGKRLVTENIEALSYAAVRMPATYSAVHTALEHAIEMTDIKINSLLDVGAGTGAGSWAANDIIDLNTITCLEREDAMMNLGKRFMASSEIDCLSNAKWEKFDLLNSEISNKADLIICSYVLNELNDNDREKAVKKLWDCTNKMLLIIEPGTPNGFKEIKNIMGNLKEMGACIIAPCPNFTECKMPEDDWCHATCRVSRTKIHKLLKNGDVPYEDEKFSYVAVLKDGDDIELFKQKNNGKNFIRVLRHPKIESGKITLQVCTKEGIGERIVTKKEKELFKIARKIKCGDIVEI